MSTLDFQGDGKGKPSTKRCSGGPWKTGRFPQRPIPLGFPTLFHPRQRGIKYHRGERMSIREKVWDASKWQFMKAHLGYTDEEMKVFRGNPRNEDVLSKAPALLGKTIVLKVVESHGCNSQHKVGDKFYFDGAGNLLTKRCPKKVCVYALSAAASMVFASNELFYAGVDPNAMRFKRAACFDVGVQCGGWGRIVLELSVQDRSEA
jgi:uncharacterized repeat protein (TIGR04076 family)